MEHLAETGVSAPVSLRILMGRPSSPGATLAAEAVRAILSGREPSPTAIRPSAIKAHIYEIHAAFSFLGMMEQELGKEALVLLRESLKAYDRAMCRLIEREVDRHFGGAHGIGWDEGTLAL